MRWLVVASIAVASCAFSAEDNIDALVERVNQAQTEAYEAVLEELDLRASRDPADANILLEECRFIRQFTLSEDNAIERAVDDEERCDRDLTAEAFASNARVQLFRLETLYGQPAIDAGEKMLEAARRWPAEDRATLYTRLSTSYRSINERESERYARLAVESDPSSPLRLNLAERWIELGAVGKAVDLIKTTPPKAWLELSTSRAAELLLRAEMPEDAVQLLRMQRDAATPVDSGPLLAKALGLAGHIDEARALYEKAVRDKEMGWRNRGFIDYFQFENAHGTREQAAAAYEKLRDRGYTADPLARYRLALSASHPTAAWRWRDLPGVLALIVLMVAVALAPVLLIAPIHYRVLAKRLRGFVPTAGNWSFREVWIALSVVMLMQVIAPYILAYDSLQTMLSLDSPTDVASASSARSLANTLLLMAPLTALCLLPIMRGVRLRTLFLGDGRVWRALGLGFAAFLLVRVVTALYSKLYVASGGVAALGDVTTQAIQGIGATYGVGVAVLLVAAVVPLLEETVFRGIVLQGLARYIPFGWAALFQAVVFAALHESVAAMPIIFLIGLVAAWLMRRTGGLMAPFVLHALNNASAYVSIAATTSFLNRA